MRTTTNNNNPVDYLIDTNQTRKDFPKTRETDMTQFDYAQSNSLLKQAIEEKSDDGNGTTIASPATAAATAPAPSKVPRLLLELADHNSVPTSQDGAVPRSTRRNSRVSTSAAKSDNSTTALNALSTNATMPLETPLVAAAPATTKPPKEKLLPVKKTQHAKHKLTEGASAGSAAAAPAPSDADKKQKKARIRKPRRVIPNEKEFIPENEQPTQSDVVGGRGGRSNHHPGNRPYWIRILESRVEYTASRSDHDKARIANGILRYVQDDLRGRFLNIDGKTKRWYVLPNSVVLDKIKQALRDKYIPYWARDLKIENKKHDFADSIMGGTMATNNGNKMPLNAQNPMLSLGSPFAGLHNPNDPLAALAAINASRVNAANAHALNMAGAANAAAAAAAAANATGAPAAANKKTDNKLGFLFGAPRQRPMGGTSAIPTIDDILKVKVDQMPSFGAAANPGLMAAAAMVGAGAPQMQSIGMAPFHPVGAAGGFPPAIMSSLGLGGLPGPGALLSEAAANHGFGAGGNPTAPALPSALGLQSLGVAQSIGVPPSFGGIAGLNMKSLDNFMEEKIGGARAAGAAVAPGFAAARAAASIPSLGLFSALAGTSFDSAASHAPGTGLGAAPPPPAAAAAPPAGPGKSPGKKTDWNAMYAKALTNSQTR